MTEGKPQRVLGSIALLFLKLGATSFGGPAAHIAWMEREVVRERRWLSREEFLDLLGAVNLIPGPNSTEMAIHIGKRRGGWPGLVVAGLCFILPAALAACAFAWTHGRGTGWFAAALGGIKPVVVAVVLHAAWHLGRGICKDRWLGALGLLGLAWAGLGGHELAVLFGCGAAAMARVWAGRRGEGALLSAAGPAAGLGLLAGGGAALGSAATPAGLFWVFAKIGSVLFGSGYVLLAFLRAELVARLGWMTEAQVLEAAAIGQMVPGPVFTTATFIGWELAGPWGAAAATAGIFMPAFLFVAVSGPLIPWLRSSPLASGFLDGVNAASLALMLVAAGHLGGGALVDGVSLALCGLSFALLAWQKINPLWLVALGAAAGLAQ